MDTSTTSGRKAYPSDVSEREWAVLEPLIPAPKPGGRPARYARRAIVNGICYVLRTGGSWRQLPHDRPPWPIVYHDFRRWSDDGTWERAHTALRERLRVRLGRQATPSAALIDSQSVKTTGKGGSTASTAARS